MTRTLATRRLMGVPISDADFHDLYELHRDERVLAAFDADPLTTEETRTFLDRKPAHWHDNGFGIWMFRDPEGAFVGRCGVHRWELEGRAEVELGFIVRSEMWSQGFATEMGEAVAGYAFSTLRLPTIVGFTRPENARSRRVLEKLGFVYERSVIAHEQESVLYRRS